jgi:glycolate oxidase
MEMPIPDARVLARRDAILGRLRAALPAAAVIADAPALRAYECDAFTAYACPPLAVVLPGSTAETAAALRVCHEEGVKVVPRGAGTSLAGGALPTADAVILGLARLNGVLETDLENRTIRVGAGRTNLSVTGAVEADGFFYAPDPSSQLACAIGGNIGMNAGGAHCLKYGVTVNNLLGVTLVLIDGTVVELGGDVPDTGGLDLLALICGSEGQLGVVTEATLRLTPKPAAARPLLMGFDDNAVAGACVADIIRAGILPAAIEFMDRPCIRACEAFAQAGYPDVEALLIVEVEGTVAEIADQLDRIKAVAARMGRSRCARPQPPPMPPRSGRGARRRSARWARSPTISASTERSRSPNCRACWRGYPSLPTVMACRSPMCSTPATATCTR